jgi:hypothetical protein
MALSFLVPMEDDSALAFLTPQDVHFPAESFVYLDRTPRNVKVVPMENAESILRVIMTTAPQGALKAIYLNGRLIGKTTDNQVDIPTEPGTKNIIEVDYAPDDEGQAAATFNLPPMRACLYWVRPAGTGLGSDSTVKEYRVYGNGGSGSIDFNTIVATIQDDGSWSYEWESGDLVDNADNKFAVRAVDYAGNEYASVAEIVINVRVVAEPVASVSYSIAGGAITISGT